MPSLSIRDSWRRPLALITLGLLAILAALLWQWMQSPKPVQVADEPLMSVSVSEKPIQPIPVAPMLNAQTVALGNQLFHEPRLSQNNQISCASCHGLSTGGVDRQKYSRGFSGAATKVNTSTVFNSEFNFRQHWNGQFETLADQADASVQNLVWMGSDWTEVVSKLQQVPEYVKAFAQVYSDGITRKNVTDAIATFEQSLVTPNSRFDRHLQGDETAITETEHQGYELFRSYGCASCHQGVNVGGNLFQKFGVMGNYFLEWSGRRGRITPADLGRFNVTGKEEDRFVFRVPSLRNITLTSPYFHDGSVQTLQQAVAIMARYQLGRSLSTEQIDLIVQFLNTLTGEYQGNRL